MRKRWKIQDVERLQARGYVATSVPHPGEKKLPVPREGCKQVQWMSQHLGWWAHTAGVHLVREHRFHPRRRWRFDFALPAYKIGIEYEGVNSEKSRHTTLTGYTSDTEKYNEAQALGWTVLRFTAMNYKTVISELKKHIN